MILSPSANSGPPPATGRQEAYCWACVCLHLPADRQLLHLLLLSVPAEWRLHTFAALRIGFSQTHQQAWQQGPLSAVDPDTVEKDLAAAGKALTKLGKVGSWIACDCHCPCSSYAQ
jgi:hypothetical protein